MLFLLSKAFKVYIKGCTLLAVVQERGAVVIVWQLDLQLPMQPVPITTDVVSLNNDQGEVYNIMFVSDLQQVGGFLRVLHFHPPIKLTTTIQLKYGVKLHQTRRSKHKKEVYLRRKCISAFYFLIAKQRNSIPTIEEE